MFARSYIETLFVSLLFDSVVDSEITPQLIVVYKKYATLFTKYANDGYALAYTLSAGMTVELE